MSNQTNLFQTLKSIILSLTIFLFPLFFLPTTQDYFALNKLYLLSICATLLLVVSVFEIIWTKKLRFYKRASDFFIFIFVLAVLTSTFVASPNRVQAILNVNFGLLPILSLSIITFYLRGRQSILTITLSLSATILSIMAIFFLFNSPTFFSPLGSKIDLILFLGFTLLIQITELLTNLGRPSQLGELLNITTFVITIVGFIISLSSLLSTGLPDLPPLSYSMNSALEIFKKPSSTIFGVGIDNYSSIFTKVKDVAYNQSKFWQIDYMSVSSSTFLHILTESGLFGLISFVLLFIFSALESIKRNKVLLIVIAYLTFVFLVLPPSLPFFFTLYIILSGGVSGRNPTSAESNSAGKFDLPRMIEHLWEGNSPQDLAKSILEIDLKQKPLFYTVPLFMILIIPISSYFLGRSYLAEVHFKKSIEALVKTKIIKNVYDYQRLAILTNPYIERFRINFSQTNLLIANNIAGKAKTEAVEEADVTSAGRTASVNKGELSVADRQTITQAMQAAIAEGKAVVKLNDQKAANWENLALVYRNLINTAQGADAWTISSYERAILLDPQNPRYRLDLGGVYYLLEEYDDANRFFEQAVALKPDWPNAHYNLAWAHYQKKDYKRAVSEMQTVIKLLDPTKDGSDLAKAQKDLEEFKLKESEENTP